MNESAPPSWLSRRVARLMGSAIESGRPAPRGYTPAARWSLVLADGRRVFAKSGEDTPRSAVATWLRREYRAYRDIAAPFMPELLGWDDDGRHPLLVLEDLSYAEWPPPWHPEQIALVRSAADAVARTPPPAWAEDIEERERGHLSGWLRVSEDPAPFLGLELADERWLRRCLPTLIESARSSQLGGDSLVHFDLRSDNLCFVTGGSSSRVMLVDWNWCGRGSGVFDVMSWLPTLPAGGRGRGLGRARGAVQRVLGVAGRAAAGRQRKAWPAVAARLPPQRSSMGDSRARAAGAAHRVIGGTRGGPAGGAHVARGHRLQDTSPDPGNDAYEATSRLSPRPGVDRWRRPRQRAQQDPQDGREPAR